MNKILKNKKIFIAGHKGMVGSSLLSYLKKMDVGKIIIRDKKNLNLTSEKKVFQFIKKKKTRYYYKLCRKSWGYTC